MNLCVCEVESMTLELDDLLLQYYIDLFSVYHKILLFCLLTLTLCVRHVEQIKVPRFVCNNCIERGDFFS